MVTLIWVVLFSALAVGTELLTAWSAARSDPDAGADIGLGLLLLVGWGLAGALAGGADGWLSALSKRGPIAAQTVRRWVIVGLATGLAAAVYRSADDGELDVVNVLANFALSTIGESFPVAGPAIAAAIVAQQLATGAWRRGGAR